MTLTAFSNDVSFFVKQPTIIDAGNSYTISVTIQKQAISGISKFEIELPKGFAIRAIETSGSRFVKNDNIGKFIWLNLPSSEDLTISYQIYVPLNANKEYKINSRFFYLNNKVKASSEYSSYIKVELKNKNLSLKDFNALLAKYPNRNVYYKVQIGAFENPIISEDLKAFFKIKNEVRIDFNDGLYKYVVGPFSDYFDAKEFQETSKIKGAFLVLYFVDMKISKEDALKIIQD